MLLCSSIDFLDIFKSVLTTKHSYDVTAFEKKYKSSTFYL